MSFDDGDDLWWYNLVTHKVERGQVSPASDRVGPFKSEAEASRAPQVMAWRSHQWAKEEAEED